MASDRTTDDPVVITGLAVEAPGEIETLAAFWSMLATGTEVIGPYPRDREWPIEELLSLGDREGWGQVPDAGGFLAGAAEFDPALFGITPREAVALDPQQRVVLRTAWRALEDAGLNPAGLDGDEAGSFIGTTPQEYGPPLGEVNEYSGFRVTSQGTLAGSGRVSHVFGFTGPSFSIDSACASSLTAVHLARMSLLNEECDYAVAGASTVYGSPQAFYEFSRLNALAVDGHVRAYSADTTGMLWGEGAGVVVLERESRARELGHRIYGWILGTAINHNGKGRPILVPRADVQERLVQRTLRIAGVDPGMIGMIEGHGTGTRSGDRAELTALHNTYGTAESDDPALLGSVKSNAGHALAAAGMLGLAKLVVSAQHGCVPPTLHSAPRSTQIDWDASRLQLCTEPTPWRAYDGFRYGAISSFGAGGANAHAIVSTADDATQVQEFVR